jgi:hypothetical protein
MNLQTSTQPNTIHQTMPNTQANRTTMSLAAAMGLLALATSANAATILWGAQQTINANTDIINPGNVVDARDFGGLAASTVNVGGTDVNFTPGGITGGEGDIVSGLFDTTSTTVAADFDSVLDSGRHNGGVTPLGTISYTGLTMGGSYTLQVFSSDDRGGKDWISDLDIGGTSTTINITGEVSSFRTATITLGAAEDSFNVDLSPGAGSLASIWMVNAAVLTTPVPEPGTGALALLATGLLAVRRRRR